MRNDQVRRAAGVIMKLFGLLGGSCMSLLLLWGGAQIVFGMPTAPTARIGEILLGSTISSAALWGIFFVIWLSAGGRVGEIDG